MAKDLTPQLFDLRVSSLFKSEGEYNKFFHLYKVKEINYLTKMKLQEEKMIIRKMSKKVIIPVIFLIASLFLFCLVLTPFDFIKFGVVFWIALGVSIALTTIFSIITFFASIGFFKDYKNYQSTSGKELNDLVKTQLDFPKNTIIISFFQRFYRKQSRSYFKTCTNYFEAYSTDTFVFILVNREFLLKIPKSDCILCETISKTINFYDTNSYEIDAKEKARLYKQYKITESESSYSVKSYGRLQFQVNDELFYLDVFPYSFEDAKKLFRK